jgi:hypothetical protein
MTEPDGPTWMDDAAARRVREECRRALTDDVPMPEDVAARLHARLAVETAAPTDEALAPVTTLPVGTRRRIPPQWFAAAAGLPASHVTHSDVVITTAAELDAHTKDLVSGAGKTTDSAGSTAPEAAPSGAASAPAPRQQIEKTVVGGLTACLASLDDSKVPLAVDEVSYEGRDSLLVLFPGEAAKQVDVFVIGPQCGGAPPDGVRNFRTVNVG